jgi:hypothetical protein
MDDKWKTCRQRLVEALACMCEHPGCHQIPCHPRKDHGGLHIMAEWGNCSRNVGLQHKVFPHYGYSNLIVAKGAKYGRENTTCHL